ncbi:aminotransferase class IV [Patescibacteria group bacterium]|nr:aminotransferase class IV [Patescibacteria group bacterium]
MGGLVDQIALAVKTGAVTPENPLGFEGDDVKKLLDELTYGFAAKLRDCVSEQYPNGLILTFHGDGVRVDEEGGHIEVDDIADEAGSFLPRPNAENLLGEEGLVLPIPEDVIKEIRVRVANVTMGVPVESRYEDFKRLDEDGQLGFGDKKHGLIVTDNMIIATCKDGKWSEAMAVPYSKLSFSPNMQAIHYGSALFEGMTAEIGVDGEIYIYGMKQHYKRMRRGMLKLGLDIVPWELFEEPIIAGVQQNARFIPRNGRLYIRPHVADIGPHMRVGNSRVTGSMVEVTPIGSVEAYYGSREVDENGNIPMRVLGVPDNKVRAAAGQGDIKAAGHYAQTTPVIHAVCGMNAAEDGAPKIYPDGVLYLDRVVEGFEKSGEKFRNARVCETNASNSLFFQDLGGGRYKVIAPSLKHGDILPGNTRKLILEKAEGLGWEIEERDVTVGEILDGKFDAAVNCGTAATLSTFDAIRLVHINEEITQDDKANVTAEPRSKLIYIRSQEAVNENPTPKPVEILLEEVLKVKTANCSDEDKKKYLTQVPGLRLKRKSE